MKYAHPAVIARSRPVGPVTERQRSIIRDGIGRCGYTEDVERAVLGNRLGKADLDELTKAEAAQTIAYLTTPGADVVAVPGDLEHRRACRVAGPVRRDQLG